MRIEHFALNIPDVEKAVQWYVDHCGMSVERRVPTPEKIHFLKDASGTVLVELYSNDTVPMPDYAAMRPRILHIAFAVDDMDAEIARLTAAGATMAEEPATTPGGDTLCFMRDPWGLAIQLAQRATPMI